MFPEEYTPFEPKRDARYDGDPEGDYILANHINTLQDAIENIEMTIGLHPQKTDTLSERIRALEANSSLRAPRYHWIRDALSDTKAISDGLERWDGLFLSKNTSSLIPLLKNKTIPVYGVVNAQSPLSVVQTEVAEWKTNGVTGILLVDLEAVSTREHEQQLFDSVSQVGMKLALRTKNPTRLLNQNIVSGYNPQGLPLTFPDDTTLLIENFAFNERRYSPDEINEGVLPLVLSARRKKLNVIGLGRTVTDKDYYYLHTAALLLGLDGFYDGRDAGETIDVNPPLYAWQAPLVNWKTDNPSLYKDGSRLIRTVPGGVIGITDSGDTLVRGQNLSSVLIEWLSDTIPGESIKDGSIDPQKLSTYDIVKIVQLLNESSDDILIRSAKIDMESGGLLGNIPAENMIVNVIEAINRKVNPFSTNKISIADAAIESLDASKLTGDIPRERFERFVIAAINASDSNDNYIDVQRLNAVNIDSTGTIGANVLNADTGTYRMLQATDSITTGNLTTHGYHTGNEGEYARLTVDWLTAYKLDGLKELHVETLTADNIGTLVLEAINARIANGTFNSIVTQALTAETVKTDLITALNSITDKQITNSALFGDAVITDAKIKDLSVTKLSAGVINSSRINIASPEGHLRLEDKTLRIYDDVDAQENRRLRVILGSTDEVTGDNGYGLVVLGPDGSTRLYDHTGVYSAGIHKNTISEEKLQDDAVSERVIRAGAIYTKHLDAEAVTAEKIAADAILAKHILAGEIVGAHIAGETITGNNIKAGAIKSGHIEAGSIDASHIKARSIDTDQLKIGFATNIIRDGYDSFEQEPLGIFLGQTIAGNPIATINRTWSWDGRNSISITGNTASNRIMLAKSAIDYTIPVMPGRKYFVSATVRTESTNAVPVTIGLGFNKGERIIGSVETISKADRIKKIWVEITSPGDSLRAAIILGVESTNVAVWFDCLQVEEAEEGQLQPGFWKATATTRIDGASIETGYVKAEHIRIGSGTVFGANNDIIDITDTGITAKSTSGSASLNSKGLEIKGGAFVLEGGISGNTIKIDGKRGIDVENSQSLIQMNGEKGFRIVSKARNQVVMDIEPETGDIRFSGKARFYSADNPLMNWTIEDKMTQIDVSIKDNSESIIEANESAREAIENIFELAEKTSYRVDLTSTKGLLFKKGTIQTDIFATVYRNNEDITDELPNSAFIWRKTKADGILDAVWESSKSGVGPRISVNSDEVLGGATFSCAISI